MRARVSCRLKAGSFPMGAALRAGVSRAVGAVATASLLVLWPLVATGQSLPAARAAAATNAAASKPVDAVAHARLSRWKPIFRGVEMCEGSTEVPRRLQVRAVRVNLREPTIDFLITPRI